MRRVPDESWHIFRRYTDFSRLHDKVRHRWLMSADQAMWRFAHFFLSISFWGNLTLCLYVYLQLKEIFPVFNFVLPPKRWFNNFNAEFLEERQLGLQDFLQHLVAQKYMRNRYLWHYASFFSSVFFFRDRAGWISVWMPNHLSVCQKAKYCFYRPQLRILNSPVTIETF